MGLYADQVLPRLVDLAMNNGEIRKLRRRAVRGLAGRVVELGFGSGLNLPHYPEEVDAIEAVDPALVGRRLARRRLEACPIPVSFPSLSGERLDLPDGSMDAVLSTFTLCTIPDLPAALREARRVLRPGGALHFAEHGRAPDPELAARQDRWNPLQNFFCGGCNLNRPIPRMVEEAGFEVVELDSFLGKGPRVMSWMFVGRAVAPA